MPSQLDPHSCSMSALKTHHLPAWLLSALKLVSGGEVEVYNSLQSLECKRSTLPKASQSRAKLFQVPSSWCANSMTKGQVHIHNTNCTVVAVDAELGVVYMTCVTGALVTKSLKSVMSVSKSSTCTAR